MAKSEDVCLGNLQELMAGGLLGASLPQPIGNCILTMERIMLNPNAAPVMASAWQPLDILGKSSGSAAKKVIAHFNLIQCQSLAGASVQDGWQLCTHHG